MESFESLLESGRAGVTLEHVGCLIFQTLFSLHVASFTLGYAHNDLHPGNGMVRDVEGTRYHNRTWAYKLRGVSSYIYVDPTVHQNRMVEIIDEGRATLTAVVPDSPDSTHTLRFAFDARNFISGILSAMPRTAYRNQNKLMSRLRTLRDRLPLPFPRNKTEKMKVADKFYDKWYTNDDEWGLGFFFSSFLKKSLAKNVVPLVVAIAPHDTIATRPDEPLAMELGDIWNMKRGMKRANFECHVCLSPAAYTTENRTRAFCGRDCYHVFYGVMDV
jgi:hypothetical protein